MAEKGSRSHKNTLWIKTDEMNDIDFYSFISQ